MGGLSRPVWPEKQTGLGGYLVVAGTIFLTQAPREARSGTEDGSRAPLRDARLQPEMAWHVDADLWEYFRGSLTRNTRLLGTRLMLGVGTKCVYGA